MRARFGCPWGSAMFRSLTPRCQASALGSLPAERRTTSSSTQSATSSASSAWGRSFRACSARRSQDVVAEKRVAKAKRTITLGELVPLYLRDREAALRPATYIEVSRYLERYWAPLHPNAIEAIQRREIVRVIDMIDDEHGKVSADRARTALSAFFAWAVRRTYLDLNPVQNIGRRAEGEARSRVLSEPELVEVWKASQDDDYGRIVRLLILTGQRKTEIGDLSESEALPDKRQIELPEARTKNGRPHVVPLSDQALAILGSISKHEGRLCLFGRGLRGFQGWSKAKAALDERIAYAREATGSRPMPAWTLHDVRRSVVTHLHELGFAQPHAVEAIVNHLSGHRGGVAGVYNKALYLAERRRALDLWGAHISALVAGRASNVVPLRA